MRVSADQDGVGMLRMIRSVLNKNDESDVGMMVSKYKLRIAHDTPAKKTRK